jgi:hypothetical protein
MALWAFVEDWREESGRQTDDPLRRLFWRSQY